MQVPHIFSPGFAARSAEVNENFAALADAITALQQRVDLLEIASATPPVPGVYTILGLQTRVTADGTQGSVGGSVFKGTVTLREDRTASLAMDDFSNTLNLGGGGITRTVAATGPNDSSNPGIVKTGTWLQQVPTVALALTLDGTTWRFARPSGRLFVGNFHSGQDGTDLMIFLIKNPAPATA